MGAPSVSNTFSASTTISSSQVNQNFTDVINAITDGTKDLTFSVLTAQGAAILNGNVTLGSSSSKDLTINASLASTIAIKTNNSFNIGAATLALAGVYLGAPSSRSTRITAHQSLGASNTLVLPNGNGTANYLMKTDGSGNLSFGWTAPTIQTFTSGTAQTYSTPANCLYIKVRMVGAGGGGGCSGTTNGTAAGAGTASTFGTTLLSAGGGGLGARGGDGGTGGTSSLGSGPIGTALTGGAGGGGGGATGVANETPGGMGGGSFYGGAGAAGSQNTGTGGTAATNTGGGGGGADNAASTGVAGAGGGSGGYVEAIIVSPSATYTYTVGAGGSGQTAGTSGFAGGAGAAGYIEVTEFYQ